MGIVQKIKKFFEIDEPRVLNNGKMVWSNPAHPDHGKIPPEPKIPNRLPFKLKLPNYEPRKYSCLACNNTKVSINDVFCGECGNQIVIAPTEEYRDTQFDDEINTRRKPPKPKPSKSVIVKTW